MRGGTVVDSTGERCGDVFIENGRIAAVGEGIEFPLGMMVLEASGCVVAPGLVDIHTHLREPGGEAAETVETGTRAASLGGYTAVVAMPNTEPAIDSAAAVRDVLARARGACADVAVA
ncbi:MAG: dihydroorotase family protein, partial [Acidimicrobiales bacterium]